MSKKCPISNAQLSLTVMFATTCFPPGSATHRDRDCASACTPKLPAFIFLPSSLPIRYILHHKEKRRQRSNDMCTSQTLSASLHMYATSHPPLLCLRRLVAVLRLRCFCSILMSSCSKILLLHPLLIVSQSKLLHERLSISHRGCLHVTQFLRLASET